MEITHSEGCSNYIAFSLNWFQMSETPLVKHEISQPGKTKHGKVGPITQ